MTRGVLLALVVLGAASTARAQERGTLELQASVASMDGRESTLGAAIEGVARAAVATCAPRPGSEWVWTGAYFYLRIAADGSVAAIEPAASVHERPREDRRIEQWSRCVQPHLSHMQAPAGPPARVTLYVGYTIRFGTLYGGSAAVPRVVMAVPTLRPHGFERDVARRVLRRHANELRYCYETQLASSPGLETDYTLVLDVDATGAVTDAHVTLARTPSELASTSERAAIGALTDCLSAAGRRWTFPAPSGAVPVVVTVTGSLLLPS